MSLAFLIFVFDLVLGPWFGSRRWRSVSQQHP
jgi:hypothetical protein